VGNPPARAVDIKMEEGRKMKALCLRLDLDGAGNINPLIKLIVERYSATVSIQGLVLDGRIPIIQRIISARAETVNLRAIHVGGTEKNRGGDTAFEGTVYFEAKGHNPSQKFALEVVRAVASGGFSAEAEITVEDGSTYTMPLGLVEQWMTRVHDDAEPVRLFCEGPDEGSAQGETRVEQDIPLGC